MELVTSLDLTRGDGSLLYEPSTISADSELERVELWAELMRLVDNLPQRQRTALEGRAGFWTSSGRPSTWPTIANRMHTTEAAAEELFQQAASSLRAELLASHVEVHAWL
jgi:hypothetical protein